MSILFRHQHQQASVVSRRLAFWFWLGMLGTHLVYLLIFALLFLTAIGVYNLDASMPTEKINLHEIDFFRYAFFLALLPTVIILMTYYDQRFLFRSRLAADIGESLGAIPINPKNKTQYRFQQIAEEMSIASGVSMPELLLFPRDESINAFLLAGGENTLALGISQGALDHLTRDELQVIIAHQFGHLKDGYLPIFMRLAAMTAAYSAIENYCANEAITSSALERNLFFPMRTVLSKSFLGKFFALFGWLFYQYGLWLQASFSRQRIKMSDARAIQYTRYPDTLQMTLKKALALKSKGVKGVFPPRQFAHIFFHHEERTLFAAQQTHPSLKERIALLGGKISATEEEAILFEMEEATRENSDIDPVQRYRSLFASTSLLYPLLSLDRLTRSYLTTPLDPSSTLLAYFLYHSGATLFDLQQQNILENQKISAIRQAIMVMEETPPLVQLAFLPRLTKLTAKTEPQIQKLHADIQKLVNLNGQVSEFEACALMFWQAAIDHSKERLNLVDCRRDIAALFSFLVIKNNESKERYHQLIEEVFPQQAPQFISTDLDNSVQLSALCVIVDRIRKLSSSNRHLISGLIKTFYEQQKKIPLGQAYLRFTFSQILARK